MKKEIDILILLDGYIENYSSDPRVFRTAYFLKNKGYRVSMVGFKSTTEYTVLDNNLDVYHLIPDDIISFRSIFSKRKATARLINNTFSYDCIIANDHVMLSLGCMLKSLNPQAKLIYDSHEFFQDYQLEFFDGESLTIKLKSAIWRWIEKRAELRDVKHVNHIIASNQSIASVFEYIFTPKNRVSVIRNIPDFNKSLSTKDLETNFSEVYQLLELNKEFTNLIYFGNYMRKLNGMEVLLEALSKLPSTTKLIILGTDKSKGYFDDLIVNYKIEDRVIKINKLPHHYMPLVASYAKISIVPTLYSNYLQCLLSLPNKFLESIKTSLPIICIDLPEQRNIIDLFKNGFMINETRDNLSDSIVKGVNDIITNYDYYKNNAKNCNNSVDSKTDLEVLASIINYYEK